MSPCHGLRLGSPRISSLAQVTRLIQPVSVRHAQFFEVLDVVKNLLLVPPPLELRSKVEERKRQRRAAGCIDSEKVSCFGLLNPN